MTSPFEAHFQWQQGALILGENKHFIALLEKDPLVLGHVILIAKREVDDLLDLSEDELGTLLIFSKQVGSAIRKTVTCKKVGVAVLGLQTRQAHLHLVPISTPDDLNFTRAKLTPSGESLIALARELKTHLND